MYKHQIINEKNFDRITGYTNEKYKEKDDYKINKYIKNIKYML